MLKKAIGWLPSPVSQGLRKIRRATRRVVPPQSFEQWAGRRNPLHGRVYADFTDFEQEAVWRTPDVVASTEAMVALLRAVEHVAQHRIPGAFVECGVYMGGNIELMIRALEHLYPRLSDGGVLIIDDYGAMPGCRIATDEYATEHGTGWFLHRVDAHVRMTIKPLPR